MAKRRKPVSSSKEKKAPTKAKAKKGKALSSRKPQSSAERKKEGTELVEKTVTDPKISKSRAKTLAKTIEQKPQQTSISTKKSREAMRLFPVDELYLNEDTKQIMCGDSIARRVTSKRGRGYDSTLIILNNPGITYAKFIEKGGRQKDMAWDMKHGYIYVEKGNEEK